MPPWLWFLIYLLPGVWGLWYSRDFDDSKYGLVSRVIGRSFILFFWWWFYILVYFDYRKLNKP